MTHLMNASYDLRGIWVLRSIPQDVLSKISFYIMSKGTPSSALIREASQPIRQQLPDEGDNIRTLWRLMLHNNEYRMLDNQQSRYNGSYYPQDIYLEIKLAMTESVSCGIKINLGNKQGLIDYVNYTLSRLTQLRIYSLINYPFMHGLYGTPTAMILRSWVDEIQVPVYSRKYKKEAPFVYGDTATLFDYYATRRMKSGLSVNEPKHGLRYKENVFKELSVLVKNVHDRRFPK